MIQEVHSLIKDKYIVAGFSSLDLQMGNAKETKKAQMIGSIFILRGGNCTQSIDTNHCTRDHIYGVTSPIVSDMSQ